MILHGINASAGYGIGTAFCLEKAEREVCREFTGPENEKNLLHEAILRFTSQTEAMAERMRIRVGISEAEILLGQITMIGDPCMQQEMETLIEAGSTADSAVTEVCTMFADMFDGLEDDLMRQRATDVRDMMSRLNDILNGRDAIDIESLPVGTILVAHDLTPSMTVGLSPERICGVVTETGGVTSHSAILARALGVPAVLSVPDALKEIRTGSTLIVNGVSGEVCVSPTEKERADAEMKRTEFLRSREQLKQFRGKPTVDMDGECFRLYANIGTPKDAEKAAENDAEGIGLFRTEFLYMDRETAPDEEEQYQAYCEASGAMGDRELIIRTLDVGGDKEIGYLNMGKEENPFLGHRGIRYCLDNPELYKIQLRALLRAGAEKHNIRIMIPLVTCKEEITAVRELLSECREELRREGVPYDDSMKVGIMVETPSAAMMADVLARESDFFSIGTNDLTGYTMAADRGNGKVVKLYSTYQPAVLRSIRSVISAGRDAGIPVGMCGEAAADPLLTPLLISWGLTEFSVSPTSVLAARAAIASWKRKEAEEVADHAMGLTTKDELYAYLKAVAHDS